jgi:hypothetical protein
MQSRFLTADTWPGNHRQPLTLNKWLYTNGNPTNHTDPSGHCFVFAGLDTLACAAAWGFTAVATALVLPPLIHYLNSTQGAMREVIGDVVDNCNPGRMFQEPSFQPEPGGGSPWWIKGVAAVVMAAVLANAATGGSPQTVGQPHPVPTPQPTSQPELIYPRGKDKPKTLSLHRPQDWETGLGCISAFWSTVMLSAARPARRGSEASPSRSWRPFAASRLRVTN